MNETIGFRVEFFGLEALDNLKLPPFKMPDLSGGLPSFNLGLMGGVAAAVAALFKGLEAAAAIFKSTVESIKAGVELRSGVNKTFSRASALSGENKGDVKRTLDPVITKLILNPSVNTPVKDIQEAIVNLSGLGLTAKDVATVIPEIQSFSGATGENINVSAEAIVKQINKASLKLNEKDLKEILNLNTALLNTSPLTLSDIQTLNQYTQIQTDGSRDKTLKSIQELAVISAAAANRGGRAESIGTGIRAFQTSLTDKKAVKRSGFKVTENTGILSQMTEVLKQYVELRNLKGVDYADGQLNKLVGDTGLGTVKQLATGAKTGEEVVALMQKTEKDFLAKIGTATKDTERAAAAAVQDLDGAMASMEATKEGFIFGIGRAFESIAEVSIRGVGNVISTLFPPETFEIVKTGLDSLAQSLNGLKIDSEPFKEIGVFIAKWVADGATFLGSLISSDVIVQTIPGVLAGVKSLTEGVLLTIGGIGKGIAIVVSVLAQLGLGSLLALVGELAKTVGIIVSGVVNVVANLLGVGNATAPVVASFEGLVVLVKNFNTSLVQVFGVLNTISAALYSGVILPMQRLGGMVSGVINGVVAGVGNLINLVNSGVIAAVSKVASYVSGVINNLAAMIKGVLDRLQSVTAGVRGLGSINLGGGERKAAPPTVNVKVQNFSLDTFSRTSLRTAF